MTSDQSKMSPSQVTEPALYRIGIYAIVGGLIAYIFAELRILGSYSPHDAAIAIFFRNVAIGAQLVGWLAVLTGCVVHAIRVEAEAIRRNVSVRHEATAIKRSVDYGGTKITWWDNGGLTYGYNVKGDRSEYPTLEAAKQAIDKRQQ